MTTITTSQGKHVIDAPLTTATVESLDSQLLLPDIDRRILKIRPMATPIDQISRSAHPRTSASMEVEYYSVDMRPSEGLVSAITAGGSSGVYTITISGRDAASGFSRTDTVLVSGGLAGDESHTFYVTDVAGGVLTATYIGPEQSFAAAANPVGDTRIVRMGRAASELDVQTPQTTFVPTVSSNFCQIFKAQVEQGALLTSGINKADLSFTDQQEAAIIDMRMGMERSFLFGASKKLATPDGNVFFTRGIWHQVDRQFTITPTFGAADFVELCRQAFTGHAGSARKVLVGGSQCVKSLVSPSSGAAIKSVGAVETEIHWGLNLKVISSNFGTLYVVHSETFDHCGYAGAGMIIDPEYLQKYTHIPFSALRLDLKKSGQRNTDAVVLTEASCLVLRYPEAHMRLITATA